MTATRDEVMVLLKLAEAYQPSLAARKFAYSDRLASVVAEGTFFDVYPLDSDERFGVDEIATCFEHLADLWQAGIVDRELALNWAGGRLLLATAWPCR